MFYLYEKYVFLSLSVVFYGKTVCGQKKKLYFTACNEFTFNLKNVIIHMIIMGYDENFFKETITK